MSRDVSGAPIGYVGTNGLSMRLQEREIQVTLTTGHDGLLPHFAEAVKHQLSQNAVPQRFVISSTDAEGYHCEVGVIEGAGIRATALPSIFEFRQRVVERTDDFTAVFLVPTGIGAELGGHAGDAGSAAKLFSAAADRLIVHPKSALRI